MVFEEIQKVKTTVGSNPDISGFTLVSLKIEKTKCIQRFWLEFRHPDGRTHNEVYPFTNEQHMIEAFHMVYGYLDKTVLRKEACNGRYTYHLEDGSHFFLS